MFSRPVRRGLNPAPSAISAPTRPRIAMRPVSGLISPVNILSSVVFPAPLRPTIPRQSPARSSNETSRNAQNSSLRSPTSLTGALNGFRSERMSLTPYHRDRLRLRQNFFDAVVDAD